jgi:hypothetical protein
MGQKVSFHPQSYAEVANVMGMKKYPLIEVKK